MSSQRTLINENRQTGHGTKKKKKNWSFDGEGRIHQRHPTSSPVHQSGPYQLTLCLFQMSSDVTVRGLHPVSLRWHPALFTWLSLPGRREHPDDDFLETYGSLRSQVVTTVYVSWTDSYLLERMSLFIWFLFPLVFPKDLGRHELRS